MIINSIINGIGGGGANLWLLSIVPKKSNNIKHYQNEIILKIKWFIKGSNPVRLINIKTH